MSKRNKIIYWIATCWLALGMVSSGLMQIIMPQEEIDAMQHLEYPLYFFTIIGVWKLLGVVAIFLPKTPLLKEWAYAGFFFCMSGAIISHTVKHDEAMEFFGPTLLLVLIITSWFYRPAEKKVITSTN